MKDVPSVLRQNGLKMYRKGIKNVHIFIRLQNSFSLVRLGCCQLQCSFPVCCKREIEIFVVLNLGFAVCCRVNVKTELL